MSKNDLWTERHRPKTLADYVWSSADQQQQVQAWVKEGKIGHLLLVGSPGVGKCLGPNERIKIRINLDTLPLQIKQRLAQFI
jgi:hypothetical protein